MRFQRKIYTRGGSHETTIPRPLLLTLDEHKKYDIVFEYDQETGRHYVEFVERTTHNHEAGERSGNQTSRKQTRGGSR